MSRFKTYLKNSLLVILVFLVCFGLGAGISSFFNPAGEVADEVVTAPPVDDKERVNILLLGVDARPRETDNTRSDTIILACIDPELNRAAFISVPRDTKVSSAGLNGMDKINAANVVGGPELAVEKVSELLGEPIDYYIEVDFEGFKDIIDIIGGITVDVDQRMYKPTEDIDLQPGVQKLDGYDALAFVRFRGYLNGDIDRTKHQQEFIKALGQELLQPATLVKLPALIREARSDVRTNLSLTDMLKIASWAPGFSSENIIAQTLPGYFADERNAEGVLTASYWVADRTIASTLLDKMLAGETVPYLVASPPGVRTTATASSTKDDETKTDLERSALPSPGHETRTTRTVKKT